MNGNHDVPIYILKYEDLKSNYLEETKLLLAFMLNTEYGMLEGTLIDKLINQALGSHILDLPQSYKPRTEGRSL